MVKHPETAQGTISAKELSVSQIAASEVHIHTGTTGLNLQVNSVQSKQLNI